jgi:hypothetical protein
MEPWKNKERTLEFSSNPGHHTTWGGENNVKNMADMVVHA